MPAEFSREDVPCLAVAPSTHFALGIPKEKSPILLGQVTVEATEKALIDLSSWGNYRPANDVQILKNVVRHHPAGTKRRLDLFLNCVILEPGNLPTFRDKIPR